jgi:hypothetical protein
VHSFFINSTLGPDKKLETHIQCIFCFGPRDIIDKIQMLKWQCSGITKLQSKLQSQDKEDGMWIATLGEIRWGIERETYMYICIHTCIQKRRIHYRFSNKLFIFSQPFK